PTSAHSPLSLHDALPIFGNTLGRFDFNGGTLSVGGSIVTNGVLLRVGNGISPATLNLTGNGTHTFGNGLSVSSNAIVMGNATIRDRKSTRLNSSHDQISY